MRHLIATVVALAVASTATVAGSVALEPKTAGSLTMSLPKGWKTTTDADHAVFVAQRDPSSKDAPALIVMVQTSGVTVTEDADLPGEWKDAGSAVSGVFSAQAGNYVGFDAVLSSATYRIAANGTYTKDATHVSLGTHVAQVTSRDTGTLAIAGPKVIELSIDNKNGPTWHGWYVLRGWYANGAHTVMKLNGPWQPRSDGSLDPEAFNLEAYGKNTYYWVRGK